MSDAGSYQSEPEMSAEQTPQQLCDALNERKTVAVGQRFTRLTVLALVGRQSQRRLWLVRCDCGAELKTTTNSLTRGNTRSCGCLHLDTVTSHGYSKTPVYDVWQAMRMRCMNPNDKSFVNYGGRGITVCDRWLHSFENFLADMGEPPPNHSLERKRNNEGYSPENCKWATKREQANNMRTSKWITHEGVTLTMAQWARRLGVKYSRLRHRFRKGDDVATAFRRAVSND